ncbi:MAG: hypothetical protein HRU15_12440, partial [Planctomycetes bacterium]|nr:hypothetical protein [Planctomycetota bacterium]
MCNKHILCIFNNLSIFSNLSILIFLISTLSSVYAEQTSTDNDPPSGIRFSTEDVLYYNYLSTQTITSHIVGEKITNTSEVAWQFALSCSKSTDTGAQLNLTITIIKAKVTDPAVTYEINSSDKTLTHKHNILRHLLLLNGKSLQLYFNYKNQRLEKISGGAEIIADIRKKFPADDFGDQHRIAQQAQHQFSDTHLLRIWRSILLGANNTDESIELGQPLQRSVTRTWTAAESIAVNGEKIPYQLTLDSAEPVKGTLLKSGPNDIQA